MMYKILTTLCLALVIAAQAQKSTYIYFVKFKDKNSNAFDIKKPRDFLSDNSLLRRAKFKIKIDETDLPVNENYIKKVCSKKIKFKSASKWLNGILVEVEDTDEIVSVVKIPFVLAVQKVAHYERKAKKKPTENWERGQEYTYGEELNLKEKDAPYIYGKAYDQIKMLQGISLHQKGFSGKGIKIAVLDAGFNNANKLHWFNKLQRSNQILACKDFVDGDNFVFDGSGHGLEVMSCMATGDSGSYVGTAPGASYLLLRSEDAETEQLVEEINWSVAAEYADSFGVDIITTSLGYNIFDDPSTSHLHSDLNGNTAYISQAAELAFKKGILVICSAGNEGSNPWHKIGFPADAHHALTVGAVDRSRVIADFSSVGPTVDGVVKPDVAALGVYAAIESPEGQVSDESGTSFSTPITAGLVACLMQAHPQNTPQQINDAIRKSADRAEISDSMYGMGIPDFNYANILLGDSSFDPSKDNLINVSFNIPEKLFCFTLYSASFQTFGFKILDENGNIIKMGSQQCSSKKFQHFYIDELQLPESNKGYVFVIENEAHQTFLKIF